VGTLNGLTISANLVGSVAIDHFGLIGVPGTSTELAEAGGYAPDGRRCRGGDVFLKGGGTVKLPNWRRWLRAVDWRIVPVFALLVIATATSYGYHRLLLA
jgi:hypothetical protein